MKNFLTSFFLIGTLNTFSQKEVKTAALYSFGGKIGNCTMTWDEFGKSKRQLIPIPGVSIKSFSVGYNFGGSFKEHNCYGHEIPEICFAEIRGGNNMTSKDGIKFIIENVIIRQNGKEMKSKGMVIIVK